MADSGFFSSMFLRLVLRKKFAEQYRKHNRSNNVIIKINRECYNVSCVCNIPVNAFGLFIVLYNFKIMQLSKMFTRDVIFTGRAVYKRNEVCPLWQSATL